jgi:thiamine kinase-like enzyme
LNGYDDMGKRLLRLGFGKEKVAAIEQLIIQWNGTFETEIVISHGDYHQGNVCRRGDEFIILDWEFMHHNSVFWDLYGLLDMSHPDFPKMISSSTRLDALHAYLNRRVSLGWEADSGNFIADYHRYAIVHSLWMLGLIEKDLQKGQWDTSKLLRAQLETVPDTLFAGMRMLMNCDFPSSTCTVP